MRDLPLPPPATPDLRSLPGGVGNTTHGEGVRRGVGYGVGIKNICFSEGFDDYSTARVTVQVVGGEPLVTVHTAAVEVGQGLVTLQAQIARTELGVARVHVETADTTVGSAGSSSASRQTYMTGGAVQAACREVAASSLARASVAAGVAPDAEPGGRPGRRPGRRTGRRPVADLLGDETVESTVEWRHRPTTHAGPGDRAGQRARAVRVARAPGRRRRRRRAGAGQGGRPRLRPGRRPDMNPGAVLGQIHGGTAQGLGLALMEEIQVVDGLVRNPSFTDYLIPTILDMPPMRVDVLEHADPHAPYGLRGVGEPPTISSTPAVVAAIRAATGLAAHPGPGPARAPHRHLTKTQEARLGWVTAGLAVLTAALVVLMVWLVVTDGVSHRSSEAALPLDVQINQASVTLVLAVATGLAAFLVGMAALEAATAMQVLSRRRRPGPLSPASAQLRRQLLLGPEVRWLGLDRPPVWEATQLPEPGSARTGLRCTVLIPAHDEEAVLGETLRSCRLRPDLRNTSSSSRTTARTPPQRWHESTAWRWSRPSATRRRRPAP